MTTQTPTVALASGAHLPTIGFGTWQLTGRSAYEATLAALELGYRHIDTATMYNNEEEVGRAVRDSGLARGDVFITTKLPASRAGKERQTIEASLRALGTDHVDLWLIHWPPSRGSGRSTWQEFLALRDEGLARAVGVSNYRTAQLDELAVASGEMPVVNQIPWSPAQHDPRHLAESRERGVVVEGYSSLKNTDLSAPALVEIAEKHGVTVPQVVLRWHLQHDIVVIPKSVNRERMAANLDLLGFTLDPGDMDRIDKL